MLLNTNPERHGYEKLTADQLIQKYDLSEDTPGNFREVSLEKIGTKVGTQAVYRLAGKINVY